MTEQPTGPPPLGRWARALADEPRFLMLLPGLFWAGNAIVARSVAGDVPPVGLAFWRWTAAAILILPLAWRHLRRDTAIMARDWPKMLLLSALGISIFNTFLYLGAQSTTVLNLVMLQTTMPVLVVVGSFLVFRDTLTARHATGVVASLAGALTLVSHGDPQILFGLDFKRGDLWMLAAVVSYAAYTVLLRLRPPVYGPSFAFASFALGALLLLPFYVGETLLVRPMPATANATMAVAYVAIFASILAYLAFNRVAELRGANTAGMIVYLVPVFGTLLAVLLLGENLQNYHAIGIGLIALGVWLATLKPERAG
jgi:drug/metabolite transporter (DMT)-like permease